MAKIGAGRSIVRLASALAVLSALAVWTFAALYERQGRIVHLQEQRSDAADSLGILRARFQNALDAYVERIQTVVGVVEYDPGMTPEAFARLGEGLLRNGAGIRSLVVAPDFVISMVYPANVRGALGRDQRDAPWSRRAALMARALGETVVSGPLDFAGGGRGFIVRAPVFLDDGPARKFWGLVGISLDEETLYEVGGLTDPDLPLDVALVTGDNAPTPVAIFGDATVTERDPVLADIDLPIGLWTLAAVPKDGWTQPDPWAQRLLFGLAGLLVAALVVAAGLFVASRQVRLAETRAREAELSGLSWRLEFALAASNVGVWDVEIATDRLNWDARSRELFGQSDRSGHFSEADWLATIHPDDRARALAEAREAAAGTEKFVSLYRIVRPDGEVRHIRDIAGTYTDADGARRMVGLMWDVTADVAREEELDRRRREAEAATEAKSRFLATMSHEIRTPMTGVLGLLGLMLEEPLPDRQRERATIALASARGLLEILNDILDFSRLEAGGLRVVDDLVDPRDLVAEVMDLMAPNAGKKGLVLGQEIADAVPPLIRTDPVRLRQVLTNLVSNATKFTEEGQVVVRIGYERGAGGGTLEVEVEDSGVGIAPDQHERIFEQFVQVDTSFARRTGGTGLGLAICRQIIERMGGSMRVRSVPGMGSTFRFTVPAPEVGADAVPERADGAAEAQLGGELHILLAEDNPTNQYLLSVYLHAAGHTVEVAENGLDAVQAAARGGFDAILMDVQMPELDGLEATRRIRRLPGAAGRLPIIALTANAFARDRDACFAAGMTDYIAKPIDVPALHRALARVRKSASQDDLPRSAAGA
jgi:signal transduction histidine kinase/ActR/RegA family two-component response regulator